MMSVFFIGTATQCKSSTHQLIAGG